MQGARALAASAIPFQARLMPGLFCAPQRLELGVRRPSAVVSQYPLGVPTVVSRRAGEVFRSRPSRLPVALPPPHPR